MKQKLAKKKRTMKFTITPQSRNTITHREPPFKPIKQLLLAPLPIPGPSKKAQRDVSEPPSIPPFARSLAGTRPRYKYIPRDPATGKGRKKIHTPSSASYTYRALNSRFVSLCGSRSRDKSLRGVRREREKSKPPYTTLRIDSRYVDLRGAHAP